MNSRDLEIRCTRCDAGFAAGTQICVHCQQPMRRSEQRYLDLPGADHDADAEPAPPTLWGRVGPGLMALVFVGLSLAARTCADLSH